jgi:hypothetical protein
MKMILRGKPIKLYFSDNRLLLKLLESEFWERRGIPKDCFFAGMSASHQAKIPDSKVFEEVL